MLLRAVLRLLQDAMLHSSRLRVATTAAPAQLAVLADQLEALADQVRGVVIPRG